MKVKIFIDFWNLQLSWNDYHKKMGEGRTIKIPWGTTLPLVLLNKVGKDCEYAGTHVYASINTKSHNDRKLKSFLQTMDLFSGYKVIIMETVNRSLFLIRYSMSDIRYSASHAFRLIKDE